VRIIFMGSPDFAVPTLKVLHENHEIVAVYTQPPRKAGRGQKLTRNPVHQVADDYGLEVRTPLHFREEQDQKAFSDLKADVAVVVAYGLLLPKSIINAPRLGCLNIHASLLPRWRGAAPIHRAIMAGDTQTGICIMQMDEGLDTGAVFERQVIEIAPTDTTFSLQNRLSVLGAQTLMQTLETIEHRTPTPQPEHGITYAKKIDKEEARIDWSQSAIEIERKIRGLAPFPGAWTIVNGARLKILEAQIISGVTAQSGTTTDTLMTIACGDGNGLRPMIVQQAGKSPMPTMEFLRGYPVVGSTVLDPDFLRTAS
jgi:methionyl-tRNA formyltransferase